MKACMYATTDMCVHMSMLGQVVELAPWPWATPSALLVTLL